MAKASTSRPAVYIVLACGYYTCSVTVYTSRCRLNRTQGQLNCLLNHFLHYFSEWPYNLRYVGATVMHIGHSNKPCTMSTFWPGFCKLIVGILCIVFHLSLIWGVYNCLSWYGHTAVSQSGMLKYWEINV